MSALGHKRPFRAILAQCLLSGVKRTFMSTVLQSKDHSMATRDSTKDGHYADSQQNPMQPLN